MILSQTFGSPARLAAFAAPGSLGCAWCPRGLQASAAKRPLQSMLPMRLSAILAAPVADLAQCTVTRRIPAAYPQG
ncbi:hypothetical protein CH92_11560 [Stutzerimonas stutzeri]|uniref:Uncharacterized protein n=1 Tax=Stutzerimonas stutzeri TaxID=316 RepID=W8RZS3_STUST|nr:hypothetical protein CH92_11560 [Stutzerimonas stutzeri]